MFLYLTPKKAGITKKSQQKRDREEAEKKNKFEALKNESTKQVNTGLFANAKNGSEALEKLNNK